MPKFNLKPFNREKTENENEQQNFDLPDTICHNRYCHTGPNYSYYIDLCAAGKTGLVWEIGETNLSVLTKPELSHFYSLNLA